MKKLSICFMLLMAVFSACEQKINEFEVKGEALKDASQVLPANNSKVALNSATPEALLTIEWEAAQTGLDAPVTYRVLLDEKGGDFSEPILVLDALEEGAATSAQIMHQQLDDVLKAEGIEAGNAADLIWTVEADNGSLTTTSKLPFDVKIVRFAGGVAPFSLGLPATASSIFVDKIRTPDAEHTFTWNKAEVTNDAEVTYEVVFTKLDASFAEGVSIPADNAGQDTSLVISHLDFYNTLTTAGFAQGAYKWTVRAKAGEVVQQSEKADLGIEIFVVPQLHILGGSTKVGWTPADAIQMKKEGEAVFSVITELTAAGGGFKFIRDLNWDTNWGISWDDSQSPVTLGQSYGAVAGGENLNVAEDGVYQVNVDLVNGTILVEKFVAPETLHLVGDATDAGWTIENALPFRQLDLGKFEIYAHLEAGKSFKFPIQRNWDADYGQGGAEGELAEKGANITAPATSGLYRIVVDFTSLSYELTLVDQMYIVGDATTAGWTVEEALPLTYDTDAHVWKITTPLTSGAKFKFVPTQSWTNFSDWSGKEDGTLQIGGDTVFNGETGDYEIVLDLTNWTYTLTKL